MLIARPTGLWTDFGSPAGPKARAAGGVGTSSAPTRHPYVKPIARRKWVQYRRWTSARGRNAGGVWVVAAICGGWRTHSTWVFVSGSECGCGSFDFKTYGIPPSSGGLGVQVMGRPPTQVVRQGYAHLASGMVRPHASASNAVPYGMSEGVHGSTPPPNSGRPLPSYGALSPSPKSAGRIRERDGHPAVVRHSSINALDSRYSPYPTTGRRRSSSTASGTFPLGGRPSPVDLPPLTIPPPPSSRSGSGLGPNFNDVRSKLSQTTPHYSASTSAATSTSLATPLGAAILLPPIKEPTKLSSAAAASSLARYRSGNTQSNGGGSGFMLPPISSMDGPPSSLSSNSSPGSV